ncbi:hypothetical protein DFH07DRAFT_837213 [Mycena maculata]|uniref:Uncharacterized protein n=1 Tax=Mycena maculata TaxID=230809 RepID=A0AAD7IHG3_9AGAR|nr:hypothetical protein DFH07DRAFT_837213 [Mycena maculata]
MRSQSQETLVTLVKGLVNGPASWIAPMMPKSSFLARFLPGSTRRPQKRAEISNQFIINASVQAGPWNAPRLLAGGEYVLLNNQTLECWSVRHDKLVWSYERKGPDSFVSVSGAEVVEGGEQVNIIVCERFGTYGDRERSLIQILNLNFSTGMSTRLLSDFYRDIYGFTEAKICGNIACLLLRQYRSPRKNYSILMDWPAGSCLKLAADSGTPFHLSLISNRVLFMAENFSGTPEISLINTTAFFRHWRRTTDYSTLDTLHISEIEADIRDSIAPGTHKHWLYPWNRDFCAYESPVREGTYKVLLQLVGYTSRGRTHAMVYSYNLSLPNGTRDRVIWRRTAAQSAVHMLYGSSGFSYPGHKLRFRQRVYAITHPGDPSHAVALDLLEDADSPRLSTYTGAVTYMSRSQVIITYFK